MPDNPFKPPRADLREPSPRPGSPLRAVLLGLAVDLGGSLACSVLLGTAQVSAFVASGMSQAQATEALRELPPTSTTAILGIVLGALCSVAGGFVCARVARRDEYRLGAVMAALSAGSGLAMGGDADPEMTVLLTLSTVACVLLGAKYGRALNRRAQEPRR
jgi:uncharacterized membrane protein